MNNNNIKKSNSTKNFKTVLKYLKTNFDYKVEKQFLTKTMWFKLIEFSNNTTNSATIKAQKSAAKFQQKVMTALAEIKAQLELLHCKVDDLTAMMTESLQLQRAFA